MCRHYPNSICGKDAQFYNDKRNTGTRFRLFLCQSTQADVAFIIHNKRGKVGIKAVAKACGLHFDSGRLGRILVSKFLQQVQYLEKKMAKAAATGKQLHFRCESSMPPIFPGAAPWPPLLWGTLSCYGSLASGWASDACDSANSPLSLDADE
ncbi:hypothetical protein F25303_6011 [Fusarium sp. NRRL 25303]|nr:hypothetical protein F25303_6011 [Fusarium sp. NRRL 25303]